MPKFFKINKKCFIISGFCLMFIFCLLVANLIASSVIETGKTVSEVKSNSFEVHMISLSKSKVYQEAVSLSEDFRKIGAGGYLWKQDDYFHVISSAYANKNDAILVQNSIKSKGIESVLISVKFSSLTIKGTFTEEEAKVLTKAVNAFQECYHSLSDIAISYDTSVYNEISARLAVNNSHSTLSTQVANFETVFKEECSLDALTPLHKALENSLESSKKLCSGMPLSENQTYSSLIKYYYLEILQNFYSILAK